MAERGRPTKYTKSIGDRICALLMDGATLRQVCRMDEMPTESTVRSWVASDQSGFSAQYAEARIIGYKAMADEIIDIADNGENDWMEREGVPVINGEHIARSRLRVDTRKWLLSKALPKIYGDKVSDAPEDEEQAEPVTFAVKPAKGEVRVTKPK